jgi:hypothetical protein
MASMMGGSNAPASASASAAAPAASARPAAQAEVKKDDKWDQLENKFKRTAPVGDGRFVPSASRGVMGMSAAPGSVANSAKDDNAGYQRVGPKGAAAVPLPTLGPSADEEAAAKAAKEKEKQAKKAAREEAERKALEEKAAAKAAKEAEIAAAAAAAEAALSVASAVFASRKVGVELAEHTAKLALKPTAAALLTEILKNLSEAEVQALKWCVPAQYGAALKELVGNAKDQLAVIYACQKYCHAHQFPKVGEKKSPLIQLMFQVLYKYDICNEDGFSAWSDDDADLPGRVNATVQTTSFMAVLFEPQEADEEDEDAEADEIDAPRETC